MNILVFPCGSEIALEIHRAFQGIKDVTLIGASSVPDHGRFVFENYYEGLPHIDDAGFIPQLSSLVRREKIDLIYPAHDSAVLQLARYQDALGCQVVGSPVETCEIARSKRQTYRHFQGHLRTPVVHNDTPRALLRASHFPLFLKPDVGQGSRGTHVAHGVEDLEFYLKKDPTLLILEYLPGEEYTVDCFTNYQGALLFHGARRRNRISNGISVGTHSVAGAAFAEMAQRINDHLRLNGAWFYQVKRSAAGELVLLEVAPRIGGSSAVYRVRGVNLPVLSFYNQLKMTTQILSGDFEVELDRAWSNRYLTHVTYQHVYLDFDDCLCISGKLNPQVMRLVVQARNASKKIHLLSKCDAALEQKLEQLRVRQLFDTVINIAKTDTKSRYIQHHDAIFIDDSFAERLEVHRALGIPVFAVDAVEGLLDA